MAVRTGGPSTTVPGSFHGHLLKLRQIPIEFSGAYGRCFQTALWGSCVLGCSLHDRGRQRDISGKTRFMRVVQTFIVIQGRGWKNRCAKLVFALTPPHAGWTKR